MTQTATLVYTATPVPPVSQVRLNTAMAAVSLDTAAIEDMTGCLLLSDVTANSGGDVTRTLVFRLSVTTRLQFDGNLPLPNNSNVVQWYVVTTTGGSATIGDLLFDNGSGTGPVTVITASTNNVIVTPTAITGGTIAFNAPGHRFTWSGAAWVDAGVSAGGAFQSNIGPSHDQAAPFKNLYIHALGAGLGSVITASTVVIA